MPGTYIEVVGDVTQPRKAKDNRPIIIPHVCNNVGAFGAGVALAIAKKWPVARTKFTEFSQGFFGVNKEALLGMVQFVSVESTETKHILVANMFAQSGLRSKTNHTPLSYPALTRAMADVVHTCCEKYTCTGFEIHCPKFGTALAGGKWKRIYPMIQTLWINSGVDVTVYNYGG